MLRYIFATLLIIQTFSPMSGNKSNDDCSSFVPVDYDKTRSPAPRTMVDLEYQIKNFDVVNVQDYVS